MAPPRAARDRRRLTREAVLDAALARIDVHGLDTLSMRELANDLGVSAMSLYRHVRDKEELLDAVADRVIEGFVPRKQRGPWTKQAAAICRAVRAGLLAHPDLAKRVMGRPITSSAIGLRVNGKIAALLGDAGVPRHVLPRVYWVLSNYAMGFALFEIERNRAIGTRARRTAAERRTTVRAVIDVLEAEVPDPDALADVLSSDFDDAQFEFGLDAVLAGLDRTVHRH